MIALRTFSDSDVEEFQRNSCKNISLEEVKGMFSHWNTKEHEGRYFEMFAIVNDQEIVGQISLYQHSENVISCGPEVFGCFRKRGFAGAAMVLVMDIAKERGYKIVSQQVRADNVASIALHRRLGFETDGYVYRNKKGNEVVLYLKSLV